MLDGSLCGVTIGDHLGDAQRPVVNPQALHRRADVHGSCAVGVPQVRAEPPPAELPRCAAIVEQAVHDEADDLRPAVDDDRHMLPRSSAEHALVALPCAAGSTITQPQFQRPPGRGGQCDTGTLSVAAVEQDLPGNEGR